MSDVGLRSGASGLAGYRTANLSEQTADLDPWREVMPTRKRALTDAESDRRSTRTKRGEKTEPTREQDQAELISPAKITREAYEAAFSTYNSVVPEKLRELDDQRYTDIPRKVGDRRKEGSGAHLLHDELVQLVEWKLKHGTFRPALLGMARQHDPKRIRSLTKEAFTAATTDPIGALRKLTDLRGIGPATASLLLSVASPNEIPFFSDELFRWMMWDEPDGAKGTGWSRKIGYTEKEYKALIEKIADFRKARRGELGELPCIHLEKVAYCLGHKDQVSVLHLPVPLVDPLQPS